MESSSSAFGLLGGLVGLIIGGLVFIFWLWMLIDCITKEKDNTQKVIWALVIFFLPCVGSLIYLFARKMPRSKGG